MIYLYHIEMALWANCDYCDKRFRPKSLLGGECVCNLCYKYNPAFNFKKDHFYDALTIQYHWRVKKGKPSAYEQLYLENKKN